LLLEPTGKSPGQFQRFGVLHFRPFKDWRSPFKVITFKSGENHDWFEYEDFDGVDKYTITIE
jgi:hypothetical protein